MNKQSDLVTDIGRILKVGIDDEAIEYGMRTLAILDKIEIKAKSVLDKNEINDVKEDIKLIMQKIQEAQEKLFALQQRLIEEENPALMDKE